MESIAIHHLKEINFKKLFFNIGLREVGAAALMRVLSNTTQ